MRKAMVNKLIEFAKADKSVILLTGDLGYNCFEPYIETCKSQFLNCGICEQTMMGIAAGLALSGHKVFVYSIGNFPTLRCLEQIRNDICYNKLNVKIIINGGGMAYGYLGMSHHATEDLSILRTLPNMYVCAPADGLETSAVLDYLYKYDGPGYIRLNRGNEPLISNSKELNNLTPKFIQLSNNNADICLIGTGDISHILSNIQIYLINQYNIITDIYTCPIIKPFPDITNILNKKIIITIEENMLNGGFGSCFSEQFCLYNKHPQLFRFGLNDYYSEYVGNQNYLRSQYYLTYKDISEIIYSKLF